MMCGGIVAPPLALVFLCDSFNKLVPHFDDSLVYCYIRYSNLGGNLALRISDGNKLQDSLVGGVSAVSKPLQINRSNDSRFHIVSGAAGVGIGVVVCGIGNLNLTIAKGGDGGSRALVDHANKGDRLFTLGGSPFVAGGQLVGLQAVGDALPCLIDKLVDLVAVLACGVASYILICSLANASSYQLDLLLGAHAVPFGDDVVIHGALSFKLLR